MEMNLSHNRESHFNALINHLSCGTVPFSNRNSAGALAADAKLMWNLRLSVISDQREHVTSLRNKKERKKELVISHRKKVDWHIDVIQRLVGYESWYLLRILQWKAVCWDLVGNYIRNNTLHICLSTYLYESPVRTSLRPSMFIIEPESSQTKNFDGTFLTPSIRRFWRPTGHLNLFR